MGRVIASVIIKKMYVTLFIVNIRGTGNVTQREHVSLIREPVTLGYTCMYTTLCIILICSGLLLWALPCTGQLQLCLWCAEDVVYSLELIHNALQAHDNQWLRFNTPIIKGSLK